MRRLYLLARSKIPDLVALTARQALRGPLGLPVREVHREILWTIGHEARAEGDAALVDRLLHATTLLVNSASWSSRWGVEIPPPLHGTGRMRALRVEVRERGGSAGARALKRLRAAYGFDEVISLDRSLLWTLHLPGEIDDDALEKIIERAVVTRGRAEGLLVNPHYQEHRVLDDRSAPGEARVEAP
ncbi:MAG: hypothetical protein CME06_13610 [Gemmatimonadetes bacterium]|nr:hypothetical protein [Gemmatimonadota bacterium]